MNFSALLTIIATLFLLMACGFYARKRGIIDDVASKRLSSLIIKIGQPMMIISALTEAEFSYDNLRDGLWIVLLGMVFHVVVGILAFLLCKGFRDPDERKITEFSLMFTNGGFIGFPIMEALFGPKGLFLAAFFNISFHLFIWSWGIAILARGRSDIKLTVRKIFVNLGSVPCLIGVLIYMLAIPFPGFAQPLHPHFGADHGCATGHPHAQADLRFSQDLLFLSHEADHAAFNRLRDRQADRSSSRYGAFRYGGGRSTFGRLHYHVFGDVRSEFGVCIPNGGNLFPALGGNHAGDPTRGGVDRPLIVCKIEFPYKTGSASNALCI